MHVSDADNDLDEDLDVIVIGAGPAGALAAGLLARAGRSVLLLEQHTFPRFRIGESLLPQSLEVLDRAGVLARLRESGYAKKHGAVFVTHDAARSARFDFGVSDPSSRFDHAFQVDRATFDETLADWAAEHGARVEFGQTVRGITPRDARGRAAVAVADRTLRARFVVDAAGLEPAMDSRRTWSVAPGASPRVALFAHLELATEPHDAITEAQPGDIVIIERDDVWAWFIPLRNRCYSVGLVADEATLRSLPAGDAAARFDALTERLPAAQGLLRDATTLLPARGARVPTSRADSLYAGGVARVGDAAGFLDPVFSSGVCVALAGAERLATAIDRSLAEPEC